MLSDKYEALRVEIRDNVAEIVLCRPDKRNAVDRVAHDELGHVFDNLPGTEGVRAIVLAAEGKVFSAGGDFDMMLKNQADPARRTYIADSARHLFMAVADCPLPVVVALQGDAVGLGATVAMGCDAVVCSRNARISDPHVVIGLTAGDGGIVLWPEHVGLLRAKRYLLTGDRVSAQDAHAMGLVTDLVDAPDDALPFARQLAQRMASLPPLAVQTTKRAFNLLLRRRADQVMELSLAYEMMTSSSSDLREAVTAFKEKRKPTYQGR